MSDATNKRQQAAKTDGVYERAREKANEAVDASRDRARDAARQTAEAIETNPLGVLVGGLALGALVGAIVPRSQREKELLAPVGRRVKEGATAAIAAAREAGRSEIDNLGFSKNAAKNQAKSLLGGVLKAATTAGAAAVKPGTERSKAG